jgi:hypothetical protein
MVSLVQVAATTTIDEVVQLAVRIAKALQDAAIKSMHQKETPPS